MKNITRLFFVVALSLLTASVHAHSYTHFTKAFTAGYVFKHDCQFKDLYGHGMINCITADTCYYPWCSWGIGAKISYWRAQGHTSFLGQETLAQEVPLTFYLRKTHDFACGLQAALSLGAGVAWIKEKNYLCGKTIHKGIGEVEVGLNYNVWRCVDLASAFRYIFPRQKECCSTIDVGGCDLRAGIGFAF